MKQVTLIAYCRGQGEWNLPDEAVMALYDRMIADGSEHAINLDGQIPDRQTFLKEMQTGSHLFVVLSETGPIGMVWLNRVEFKKAHLHYCGFSNVWGHPEIPEIADWAAQRLLRIPDGKGGYMLDMLWGITPAVNPFSNRLMERMGLEPLGRLPLSQWDASQQKMIDSIMYYTTRKEGDYEDIYSCRH